MKSNRQCILLGYDEYGEAKYFADQSGTYEIRQSKNEKLGKVMMQVHENICIM